MIILGLTGSIGTGKSTTAKLFRMLGCPVHDADATVHSLYQGEAAPAVEAAFPGTVENHMVNRKALAKALDGKPERFKVLELIVHPLVRAAEEKAIKAARAAGYRMILLDIPLLFETKAEGRCHAVIVTTVHPDVQRQRVLAREGMTEALFKTIVERQMPDREKRRSAHSIIETDYGMAAAHDAVRAILRAFA